MIYTVLAFCAIALIDMPAFFQKKKWKTAILYGVLFTGVLIYAIAATRNPWMNSPLYLLSRFMERIGVAY